MLINSRKDKEMIMCSYGGTPHSKENEPWITICNNMDAPHKHSIAQDRPDTKSTYHMIPFI